MYVVCHPVFHFPLVYPRDVGWGRYLLVARVADDGSFGYGYQNFTIIAVPKLSTFGVFTESVGSNYLAKSEFIITSKILLEELLCLSDENFLENYNPEYFSNGMDLTVDYEIYSLIFEEKRKEGELSSFFDSGW